MIETFALGARILATAVVSGIFCVFACAGPVQAKPRSPHVSTGIDFVEQRLFEIELRREWRRQRSEATATDDHPAVDQAPRKADEDDALVGG